ncbi:MAG: T9SS type A sorting domain-containing protein [Chitinophagales bacterium]
MASTVATWTHSSNPIVINSTAIRINGDLVILGGAELTINNMAFEFGLEGRVIVQRGGKLTLRNSTFTGDDICTTMWQGIQVHGVGSSGQQPTINNTGKLYIIDSVIEHAVVGVANKEIDSFNMNGIAITDLGDYIANGTISSVSYLQLDKVYQTSFDNSNGFVEVTGNNTVFRDCFYGAFVGESNGPNDMFASYSPWSVIKSATFNTSGNLRCPLDGYRTEAGISTFNMVGTSKVKVDYCEFNNLKHGWYSHLNVNQESKTNAFFNCNRGISIYGLGTYSFIKFDVNNNEFSDCDAAVQATKTNIQVSDNYIEATNLIFGANIGILLRGCDFLIDENRTSNIYTAVLSLDNDEWESHIKRNIFQDGYVGVVTGGDNTGVQMFCNNFDNYLDVGIGVVPWQNAGSVGILSEQGVCNDFPTQNIFTPNAQSTTDIYAGVSTPTFEYRDFNIVGNITVSPPVQLVDCSGAFPGNDRADYCDFTTDAKIPVSQINNLPSEGEKNRAVAAWFREYMFQGDVVAAVSLLETVSTRATKRKLIPFKLSENDFIGVNQLLSELPLQSLEDQNFNAYYSLLVALKQANRDYFSSLTQSEISTLTTIAGSKTHTALDAQEHLRRAGLAYYPIELPDLSVLPHNQSVNKAIIPTPNIATISSNPITSWGRISYDLPTNEIAVLHIFNITGKKVREEKIENKGTYTIAEDALVNGLYIYTISSNQKILHREKIIIAR